jgi:heme exporter protein B
MLRDAALVAGKDLRTEWRTRVGIGQVLPFALTVVVLFGFALDADRGVLTAATPGLYWVTVLFAAVLGVQRTFSIESAEGIRDALLLSSLRPGGIFLGKAAAVAAQLLVLQVVLGAGVVLLYGADPSGWLLVAATVASATAGVAAAGSIYGVLAVGLRVRETLLPLLLLPVLAPVLLAGTQAFEAAFAGDPAQGWPWVGLLAVLAVAYGAAGIGVYATLLEDR